MEHSIEELQFAATVRQIVRRRQDSDTSDMSDEERSAYLNRPANDLIAEVVKELDGIATVIGQARSQPVA